MPLSRVVAVVSLCRESVLSGSWSRLDLAGGSVWTCSDEPQKQELTDQVTADKMTME